MVRGADELVQWTNSSGERLSDSDGLDRRPDFIVIALSIGVIVIEVKGVLIAAARVMTTRRRLTNR